MKVNCKHCGKAIELNHINNAFNDFGYCPICDSYFCKECSKQYLVRIDDMHGYFKEFRYVCNICITKELYQAIRSLTKARKALAKAEFKEAQARDTVINIIAKEVNEVKNDE